MIRRFGQYGSGDVQFHFGYQSKIAVTDDGNFIISDTWNNRLQIYTEEGQHVKNIELNYFPEGVSYRNGSIYLTSRYTKQVNILTLDGTQIHAFDIDNLDRTDIAVTETGDIVVVGFNSSISASSGEVRIYSVNGDDVWLKATFGRGWNDSVNLVYPRAVTLDRHGHIIVADYGRNRVNVMNPSGQLVRSFGVSSVGYPIDVACLLDGSIAVVVADLLSGNDGRVEVFKFE